MGIFSTLTLHGDKDAGFPGSGRKARFTRGEGDFFRDDVAG